MADTVDSQKVIRKLNDKLSLANYQNAVLEARVEELNEEISLLKLQGEVNNNGGHLHNEIVAKEARSN